MASLTRQATDHLPFRTRRGTKLRGASVGLHVHDEAQLIYAASGTMQVYTETGRWLVPPQLAVWVPAEVPHRLDVLSDTEFWMLYWQPKAMQAWAPQASLSRAFTLRVTPLLRELIFVAFQAEEGSEKAQLIVRLILHELTEMPDAPTFLPLPASPIGRKVTALALSDVRQNLSIEELAHRAATSVRTISRLFPVETGLTYKAWRQRARIVYAIDQLALGSAIAAVAAEIGFGSTAAFSHAFRQVLRTTPTAFVASAV